jgi:hypothetical protein
MRIFFRRHGNSLFYIFLPVFFLILTVALIQLTPKSSKSDPGDVCDADESCCNVSGDCGPEQIQEACEKGECIKTNVGCLEGFHVEQGGGDCNCVDGDGNFGGDCIECGFGEIPDPTTGLCERACLEGEDPGAANCIGIEGTSNFGVGAACSMSRNNNSASSMPVYLIALLALAGAYPVLRRRMQD